MHVASGHVIHMDLITSDRCRSLSKCSAALGVDLMYVHGLMAYDNSSQVIVWLQGCFLEPLHFGQRGRFENCERSVVCRFREPLVL